MIFSYRLRKALRRLLTALIVLFLAAAVLLAVWVVWLGRYVIYTQDGAVLDFGLPTISRDGVSPVEPTAGASVPIYYSSETTESGQDSSELRQLSGVYITADMLIDDFSAVEAQVSALSAGDAVLLELKTIQGEFLYSTSVGEQTSRELAVEDVDGLIDTLLAQDCYLIAKIPAFQEYVYILKDEDVRVSYGLAKAGGGGSLWLDRSGPNYWLSPASSGTLDYLTQVITELRDMGFDEVVLGDFRFPDTDEIEFDGDPQEALEQAAQTLLKRCATTTFAVSFHSPDGSLTLPDGRCRLYVDQVEASEVESLVSASGIDQPEIRMVFLTELMDTRFEICGVLRPII